MVFRWKDAKLGQNGIDKFFGPQPPDRHTIVRAKIRGKPAFFFKTHKNAVNRVFWHAEFISALKIKLNPTVSEKNEKKKKKIYNYYFLFFVIFSKC